MPALTSAPKEAPQRVAAQSADARSAEYLAPRQEQVESPSAPKFRWSIGTIAAPARIQPKLAVGAVDDPLEHEADRVADQVVGQHASAARAGTRRIHGSGSPAVAGMAAWRSVHEVLRSPGRPLDSGTRAFMEPRFGFDLGGVRLHTGARAAESAHALRAHAYTAASDIVFGAGRYAPQSDSGRRLLAHELTHVAQQRGSSGRGPGGTVIMRQPDYKEPPKDQQVVPDQTSYRVEDTPFTVTPLKPAQSPKDVIRLFGYSIPYHAVRVTNEDQVTAMPKLPLRWKDAADVTDDFHVKPGAAGRLYGHASEGTEAVAKNVPQEITVDKAPPGQPPANLPRFSITVRSDGFGLDVLDQVMTSLHPEEVPGTPLHGKLDEDNLRRDKVIDPSIHVGKRVYAHATLSMRDPYPRHGIDPTEVSVDATSVPLASIHPKEHDGLVDIGDVGTVRVNAMGIAGAKGNVSLFIEEKRIAAALAPLGLTEKQALALTHDIAAKLVDKISALYKSQKLDDVIGAVQGLEKNGALRGELENEIKRYVPASTKPAVIDHAIDEVISETLHPGFAVQGPIYFGAPIGYGYFKADTTRETRKPFEGSAIGTPFPATLATGGPTVIPKGVLGSTATPALGGILARDFQSLALSASIAARPYLDPGAGGVAGIASVRAGFRVKGFDVIIEGGFHGQAQVFGGSTAGGKAGFFDAYKAMEQASQDAVQSRDQAVRKDERGEFAPDLRPAGVLADPQFSEFYGTVKLVKKF